MRGHRDLKWASSAAVVCALVAALTPWEIVRLAAALPLTLFLPGYAIIAAAFGSQELGAPKRLTLSVATSLMVLALGAFVLNVFPFGLRTASWAVLLPLVVIAVCRGAALRRGRPAPARRGRRSLPRPAAGSIALASLALLIAVAALVLAQKPLPAENAAGFSALWMLPTDAAEDAVAVGVVSSEQDPASYRLEVRVGRKSRPQTYRLDLDPGEERVYEFEVPPRPGARTYLVASLYREERPERVYRRVTSWLPRHKTFP